MNQDNRKTTHEQESSTYMHPEPVSVLLEGTHENVKEMDNVELTLAEQQQDIFIGASAGYNVQSGGDNNIEIGAVGKGTDTGQIRIGRKGVQTTVHL